MGKHKKKIKKKSVHFPGRESVLAKVETVTRDICRTSGMKLAFIESSQREDFIISVYVDKPGGVTLDDCVAVNRELGDVLDIELDVNVPYRLEVSSPGIDFVYPDYENLKKNTGNHFEIRTLDPGGKRKKTKGLLKGVTEDCILLEVGDRTREFSINEIKRARITGNNGEAGC